MQEIQDVYKGYEAILNVLTSSKQFVEDKKMRS